FRGGFGIFYDRVNTVQTVNTPALGVGFGQTINVGAPSCSASLAPGPNCNPSPSQPNPGLSSYRVGVDGAIPLPVVPAVGVPVVPQIDPARGVFFSELVSRQLDPQIKVDKNYTANFTIQKLLP